MKLKFKDQEFQTDAVNAVCDLFIGQEKNTNNFLDVPNLKFSLVAGENGMRNSSLIADSTIISNMNRIQESNNLSLTTDLQRKQFCIEMETGTGKTYVYIKTIFELNKRYGFTKFIIVVPSVAIREGVCKSLQITENHFKCQYNNCIHRFFTYSRNRLAEVKQFAINSNIEIMVINIDAFKKSENVINQAQDKLNGNAAICLIRETNPIVIIDEPQSVDNTAKSKDSIASLNPLFVLRYSATHKEEINLLYKLTPVDAYKNDLVKQISVCSTSVIHDYNSPYIKLLSVSKNNGYKAEIEIDVINKKREIERKKITMGNNADLFEKSGGRRIYEGYIVENIDCAPNNGKIMFANKKSIVVGNSIDCEHDSKIKREQIRLTIKNHLDKELSYLNKGIKVLSLFFIDEVKKYRSSNKINDEGNEQKLGKYAKWFEECYCELINDEKYSELRKRFGNDISSTHDGYFSCDKKGAYKNTKGDNLENYDTYNIIMRDKEKLLSFECPLRFILYSN